MILTTIARAVHGGYIRNCLLIYHSIICFVFFYGLHAEIYREKIKKEIKITLKIFAYINTFLSITGILIAAFFGKYEVFLNNKNIEILSSFFKNSIGFAFPKSVVLGVVGHKLAGVYINSNLLGITNVLSIVSCFFLLSFFLKAQEKKKKSIWIIVFCLIINIFSLFLTDSLASIVFLIIYILSLSFCSLIEKNDKKRTIWLKVFILAISFLILTLIILTVIDYTQRGFNFLANTYYRISRSADFSTDIGRRGIYQDDITSNRLLMLKQGLSIFTRFWFFGVSRANIKKYYDESSFPGKMEYDDLHNGYLTVLVSWGTLGFIIFLGFLAFVSFRLLKYLFKKKDEQSHMNYSVLFSLLVAYSVYSFAEITVLSNFTFSCGFFWIVLGWAMHYAKPSKQISKIVQT